MYIASYVGTYHDEGSVATKEKSKTDWRKMFKCSQHDDF